MAGRLLTFTTTIFLALQVFAASGITYQGRIVKPDGTPLSGTSAQFKIQIRTPDTGACLLYEETQTLDLSQTKGAFSLTLSEGTRSDSSGLSFDKLFANQNTLTVNPATCASGSGSYTPVSGDGRSLVVEFKDETMAAWEQIPSMKINYVPYAIDAKQVAGFPVDSLFRVVDGSGAPLTGLSPLSNAQYTNLIALANGTSTAYSAAGTLGGVAIPSISSLTSGQALTWNGTTWVATSVPGGAGSVTQTMIANNAVSTNQVAGDVTINTTGTLGAAFVTARDFKIYSASPGTGFVEMKSIVPNGSSTILTWPATYGTAGQVLTTDATGTLSWSSPSGSSQWTTHGSNISYDGTGNVGIGTTSPLNPLQVNLATTSKTGVNVQYTAGGETGLSGPLLQKQPMILAMGGEGVNEAANVGIVSPAINVSSNSPTLNFASSRATTAELSASTYVALQTSDVLGSIVFGGDDGTGLRGVGAQVTATAGAPWTSSSRPANLKFSTTATGSASASERMRITPAGLVGFGVTAPTAIVHLKAGTAAVNTAPLKFSSGPVMTTPEDGAMEYDGTGLSYTIGTTRYVIPMNTAAGNYSNVATIGNTTGSITMTPMSGNSVIVNSTTVSTSATTGALVVNGGAGVSGAVNASGNITSGGSVTATNSIYTPQVYGGTTAAANISIDGADNATKGNIYLASAGGKVGIGTTSPQATLDVNGSINVSGTLTGSVVSTGNSSAVYSGSSSSVPVPAGGKIGVSNLNTAANGLFAGMSALVTNTSGNTQRGYFGIVSNAVSGAYAPTIVIGQQVTDASSYQERLRIDPNGNVGIGTTSPGALLDLKTSAAGYQGISITTTDTSAGSAAQLSLASDNVSTQFRSYSSGSGNNFQIQSGASSFSLKSTNASGKIQLQNSAGTNQFTLDTSTGYLGLGTANPVVPLQLSTSFANVPVRIMNTNASYSSGFDLYESGGTTRSTIAWNNASAATNPNALQITNWLTSPIVFRTTGTERMRLDGTGFVGIGTTSPATRLDVAGGAVFRGPTAGSVDGELFYDSSVHAYKYFDASANSGAGAWQSLAAGAITYNGTVWQQNGSNAYYNSGNVGVGTTSPLQALTVIGNGGFTGNVGIGTTSPLYPLTVNGSGSSVAYINSTSGSANLTLNNPGGSQSVISFLDATTMKWQLGKNGSGNPFFIYDGTNGRDALRIDSSTNILLNPAGGNLGIGTGTPGAQVDIANMTAANPALIVRQASGQTANLVTFYNSSGSALTSFSANGRLLANSGGTSTPGVSFQTDGSTGVYLPSTGLLGFTTGGADRMRIDATGNVGIGTTSPSSKLTVVGTIESTSGGVKFPDATTQTTAADSLGTMIVVDQQPINVGEDSAGATFTKRTLNTVNYNSISGASLASSQITLPAGTYMIEARAPGNSCFQHQAIWYNVTDSTTDLLGTTEVAASSTQTDTKVNGVITITSAKVYELRHATYNSGTNYFGRPNIFGSGIFSSVTIHKMK